MNTNGFRMFHWLLFSAALYLIAQMLALRGILPQLQVICWKLGHVSIAANLGYWIDRNASRSRLSSSSAPEEHLRRAIIMAAAMLAIAWGM